MVQMADASRDGVGPFLFLEPEEMVLAVLLEPSNISGVFPLKRGKRVWWFSGTDIQMPPRVASFCRKQRTWSVLPVRCARLYAGSLGQASMHDRDPCFWTLWRLPSKPHHVLSRSLGKILAAKV